MYYRKNKCIGQLSNTERTERPQRNVMDETPSWYLAKWRTLSRRQVHHCQSLQSRKWLHEFEYREFTTRCKYLVTLKKTSEIACTAVRHGGVSVIAWACVTASGTKSLVSTDNVSALKCTGLYALLRFKQMIQILFICCKKFF